jgi:heavy metal sensor kinase
MFAVLTGVAGVAVYQSAEHRFNAVTDKRVSDLCTGLWGYIVFVDNKPTLAYDDQQREILHFISDASRFYQLYDGVTGQLLSQSKDAAQMHLALPAVEAMRLLKNPGFEDVAASGGLRLRFHSAVFRAAQRPYLLRVGIETTEQTAALRELVGVLLFAIPGGTFIAAATGWWMARRFLRPLQELRMAAHEIGISQLHRRVPVHGTEDELDALAQTFNEGFTRLEGAVGRMKQFAVAISHELRTPLAVLQGETEVALMKPGLPAGCRQVLSSQLEEFHKLRYVINQLLTLAQAHAGEIQFEKQAFDISTLVLGLGEQMGALAKSKGIALHARCTGSMAVTGDAGWLQRVFLNLLDNAIKFTPQGGNIQLLARATKEHAVIEVVDTGIGISEQALPHIFDRFYRAGSLPCAYVEGTGLGLTLAKWIVEAHGGVIQVKSQLGAGSCFSVSLPLSAGAAIAACAAE